jgi:hypothetical protein
MTLAHSANPGRHRLAERGDDLYETPLEAVRALLAVETLPSGVIWEPACGPGSIVRVLRSIGYRVWSTDLVDYGSPDQDESGIDFLLERSAPSSITSIVTNPPFKLAEQFARCALTLCPRVYMLLRLGFLESERRRDILDSGSLKTVYVGRRSRNASPALAFAWYCWDRQRAGRSSRPGASCTR